MSVDPSRFPTILRTLSRRRDRASAVSDRRYSFFQTIRFDERRRVGACAAGGARGRRRHRRRADRRPRTAGPRRGFRRRAAGLYVSIVLEPRARAAIPSARVALLTLAAGVALAEADRTRRPGFAPRSSGRTICSWRAESWPAFSPKAFLAQPVGRRAAGRVGRARLRHQRRADCVSSGARRARRRRSKRSSGARSIARALCAETLASLARALRGSAGRTVRCYSRRVARRAPGSRGAPCAMGHAGGHAHRASRPASTMGALLVRVGARTERLVAGEVSWSSRTS